MLSSTRVHRLCTVVLAAIAVVAAGVPLAAAATAAPTGTLTGRVTGVDGNPLARVAVALVIPGPNGEVYVDRFTTTDGNGRYTFTGDLTSTGEYLQFSATGATGGRSATGYSDQCYGSDAPWCQVQPGREVSVRNGATRTINAVLGRAGVLSGRATDSAGRGVGGVAVTLWATYADFEPGATVLPVQSTTTDANGNYRTQADLWSYTVCIGVPASVTPGSTPGRFGHVGECSPDGSNGGRVVVTAGATTTRNAVLTEGAALGGTVVDTSGRAIAGASVVVTPETGDPFDASSGTSRADGTFTVFGLDPGQAQTWCVRKDGYQDRCSPGGIQVLAGRVTNIGRVVLSSAS